MSVTRFFPTAMMAAPVSAAILPPSCVGVAKASSLHADLVLKDLDALEASRITLQQALLPHPLCTQLTEWVAKANGPEILRNRFARFAGQNGSGE